jgi:hypothetical protein
LDTNLVTEFTVSYKLLMVNNLYKYYTALSRR